jgi:hypothetical protein
VQSRIRENVSSYIRNSHYILVGRSHAQNSHPIPFKFHFLRATLFYLPFRHHTEWGSRKIACTRDKFIIKSKKVVPSTIRVSNFETLRHYPSECMASQLAVKSLPHLVFAKSGVLIRIRETSQLAVTSLPHCNVIN